MADRFPVIGSSAELIQRILQATRMTQRELGELLGYDRRTIVRWVARGTTLLPSHCEKLATACHPHDRALAGYLAGRAGKTLVDLGLEKPAARVPAPAPQTPAPARARAQPSARHMVDSVVCSAAEAMQMTPQAARPGLLAAFERASALGMTVDEVLAALATAAS
jgi:hypothetical protein